MNSEDDELVISKLLNSLEGIEKCFEPDYYPEDQTSESILEPRIKFVQPINEKKRIIDDVSSLPPLKKINLKDPRQRKMISSLTVVERKEAFPLESKIGKNVCPLVPQCTKNCNLQRRNASTKSSLPVVSKFSVPSSQNISCSCENNTIVVPYKPAPSTYFTERNQTTPAMNSITEKCKKMETGVNKSRLNKRFRKDCFIEYFLPPEILIKIFQYLSLRDKKAAKLVCKRWYDVCNIKFFMQAQRFVCCGNYDTSSILQMIMRSKIECFNLEFYRVEFINVPEFWKQVGPKIHSLYFVDCTIGEGTLREIIINCTEMEHLSFTFEHLKTPSLILNSLTFFEELSKEQIVRPKVVSFDVQISSSSWFSNSIFSNFFLIFPNILRLGFVCHSLNPVEEEKEAVAPEEINFSDLWSSRTLTFSPVLKYIWTRSDSMNKLKLDLHTTKKRTGFAWESIINYAKMSRLREMVFEIDLKKVSGNVAIEFCCQQKELKKLSCRIIGSAKLFVCLFLLKIVDTCRHLRSLDVSYNASFFLSYELLRGLILSKLKSLSMQVSSVSIAPQIVQELDWPINEHLKSVSLSRGVGETLKNLFIKIFRNLKYLELHDLSDETLQMIWQYQTNLVALKLAGVERCTTNGFCGLPEINKTSIRKLEKLEYLVLEAVDNEWSIPGEVFSEFHLPKLRFLCVDIEGSLVLYGHLFKAMRNFSHLEAVSVTCSGVPRQAWLELTSNWKELRFLRIVDKESTRFKVKQYRSYFTICSKLRALVHEFKSSSESYYYDVLEKEIKRKTQKLKYRISSEKVGGCFIDWVWF